MSTSSPNNTTGRRKRLSEPDATRRIVVANFNNETDALEILAKAATDADDGDNGHDQHESSLERKRVSWADAHQHHNISDFVLIKRGVLDERTLEMLVQAYFQHHHPVLVSYRLVPADDSQSTKQPEFHTTELN